MAKDDEFAFATPIVVAKPADILGGKLVRVVVFAEVGGREVALHQFGEAMQRIDADGNVVEIEFAGAAAREVAWQAFAKAQTAALADLGAIAIK